MPRGVAYRLSRENFNDEVTRKYNRETTGKIIDEEIDRAFEDISVSDVVVRVEILKERDY